MYRLLAVLFFSYLSYYHPGAMEHVARVRHMPPASCEIATMPTIPLGSWLTVRSLTTGVVLRCRVTDVVAGRDVQRHVQQGVYAEAGWHAAQLLCGVKVYGTVSPHECRVIVSQSTARAVSRRMAWRTR